MAAPFSQRLRRLLKAAPEFLCGLANVLVLLGFSFAGAVIVRMAPWNELTVAAALRVLPSYNAWAFVPLAACGAAVWIGGWRRQRERQPWLRPAAAWVWAALVAAVPTVFDNAFFRPGHAWVSVGRVEFLAYALLLGAVPLCVWIADARRRRRVWLPGWRTPAALAVVLVALAWAGYPKYERWRTLRTIVAKGGRVGLGEWASSRGETPAWRKACALVEFAWFGRLESCHVRNGGHAEYAVLARFRELGYLTHSQVRDAAAFARALAVSDHRWRLSVSDSDLSSWLPTEVPGGRGFAEVSFSGCRVRADTVAALMPRERLTLEDIDLLEPAGGALAADVLAVGGSTAPIGKRLGMPARLSLTVPDPVAWLAAHQAAGGAAPRVLGLTLPPPNAPPLDWKRIHAAALRLANAHDAGVAGIAACALLRQLTIDGDYTRFPKHKSTNPLGPAATRRLAELPTLAELHFIVNQLDPDDLAHFRDRRSAGPAVYLDGTLVAPALP